MKINKNWDVQAWKSKHQFTFILKIERWNEGDEWRVYFLFWEINIAKVL